MGLCIVKAKPKELIMAAKIPNLKTMTAASVGKLLAKAIDQHESNMWDALNKMFDNVCIHDTNVYHEIDGTTISFCFDCEKYGTARLTAYKSMPGYDIALHVSDVDSDCSSEWHNHEHVDKLSDIPKALERLDKVCKNPAKLIKKLKATAITEDMGCEYREHAIYNARRYELYVEQQIAKVLPDMSRIAGCTMHLSTDINDPDFTPEFGIEFYYMGVRFNLRICDENMYLREKNGDGTEYDVTFGTLQEVAEKILKKDNPNTETTEKKYELTDETIEVNGHTLHRIRAVREITDPAYPDWKIETGDLGGFIESDGNLSHDGAAWVLDDGKIYGNAKVYENAFVYDNAEVYGNANVYGNAWVHDNAEVFGNAEVYGDSQVYGNANVYGNAKVYGDSNVSGDAIVGDDVEVYGDADVHDAHLRGDTKVGGNPTEKKYELTDETIEVGGHTLHRIRAVRDIIDPACPDWEIDKGVFGGFIESEDNLSHEGAAWVDGDAKVFGNAKVYGDSIVCGVAEVFGDAEVYDNANVSGRAKVYGNAKVYGKAMVCVDAKVYDNAKVYEDADIRGDSLVYGNAEVCGDTKVCGVNVCEDTDEQDLPTKIAETFRQMAETGSETKVTQRELDAYNGLLETLIKAEVPSATNIKRETLSQLELHAPADDDECDHRIYFTYDGIPFRITSLGTSFWVGAGVKCPDDPKTYYGELCSSSEDTLANLGHIVLSLASEWKLRYTPDNIPNDYDYDFAAKGKATDKNGQPSSDADRLSKLETKVEKLAADMVDAQAKVKKIAKDMKGALSDIKSIKKKLKK